MWEVAVKQGFYLFLNKKDILDLHFKLLEILFLLGIRNLSNACCKQKCLCFLNLIQTLYCYLISKRLCLSKFKYVQDNQGTKTDKTEQHPFDAFFLRVNSTFCQFDQISKRQLWFDLWLQSFLTICKELPKCQELLKKGGKGLRVYLSVATDCFL